MYTKEQLQAMSDFEVNEAVTLSLNLPLCQIRYGDPVIDYCNNPSDIMPLAFEHGVAINIAGDIEDYEDCKGWVASGGIQVWHGRICTFGEGYFDTNPLRAIACCLILVLQERDK